MDVAISGSSGLIGSALRPALEAAGHQVVPLVRGEGREGIRWDPEASTVDAGGLEGLGGLVHLAGEPLRAALWTKRLQRRVLESRSRGTRALAGALAGLQSPPPVMVSASAVGYYGERGDEELTEASAPGEGFMAEVVRAWEAATAPAEEAGIRVAHCRTGLVLSRRGGLLPKFLPLGRRFLVAGRLGSGRQWMSWISIDDEVAAILHLLHGDGLAGPFNLTGPRPVSNAEFASTLARVVGRPKLPPVPGPLLKLALGRLAASEAALISQRVLPTRLQESGFTFRHPELTPALEAALAA